MYDVTTGMKSTIRGGSSRPTISLMTKFNLVSLAILILGSIFVSRLITRQIELRVLSRIGHTTSLFAGSVFAPEIVRLLEAEEAGQIYDSDRLDSAVLGPDVIAFKIWNDAGIVIDSSNTQEIGQQFPVEEGLADAWNGIVSTEISDLSRSEHAVQRKAASRLIETYAPIRRAGGHEIIAVIEFYQDVKSFQSEIVAARRQAWAVVAVLVAVTYVALVILFRNGSRTIDRQRGLLEQRIEESERLLEQNIDLNNRLLASAARTTTLTRGVPTPYRIGTS